MNEKIWTVFFMVMWLISSVIIFSFLDTNKELRTIIDIQNETIRQYSELSSKQDDIIKLQDEIINVSE